MVALGVACRRPQLVRTVTAHEPPLVSLLADDDQALALIAPALETIERVVKRVQTGDHKGGARQFIEELALGRGAWERLPASRRQTAIRSALAFAAESSDADWTAEDPTALAGLTMPVLITQGDQSPAWFAPAVAELGRLISHANVSTYRGAGHAPHATHPDAYVARLLRASQPSTVETPRRKQHRHVPHPSRHGRGRRPCGTP